MSLPVIRDLAALERMNKSGLGEAMVNMQTALLNKMTRQLQGYASQADTVEELSPKQKAVLEDQYLLNSVGPAAAHTALQVALASTSFESRYNGKWNRDNPVANAQLIMNDGGVGGGLGTGQYGNFSNVLRQFLLPRYAYLDFDRIVDPRHMIDQECGYPKFITPIMYRYMYDRDDMAQRVVNIYSDEIWAIDPVITDSEEENEVTPFKEDIQNLIDNGGLLQMMYRMSKLAGIGHYGALLMGYDDSDDLEKPVQCMDIFGNFDPEYKGPPPKLLYMRPFDEYLSFIQQFETKTTSPRYGLPVFYNLVFLDMTIDAAGASIGTRLNRRVHWTRVRHIADNLMSSLVFGIPRMQNVFNRLLDLRKIKGGSAEMFWKGAFPGISFEIDPRFVADNPEIDKEKMDAEVEAYANGLQRYLRLVGVKAVSLAPTVASPKEHVEVQERAVASNLGVPFRVFMGSEEGRLASSQDKLTWNTRLLRKINRFENPQLIRNIVNGLLATRTIRPPKDGKYFINWDDLNTPTDEDKANLALKWTQAATQYVASGMIHLVQPEDYFTTFMGFTPSQAIRLADAIKANGLSRLLKVDPSQGAGVNGKRTSQANGDDSGDAGEGRKTKRDSNDKKIEGSSS